MCHIYTCVCILSVFKIMYFWKKNALKPHGYKSLLPTLHRLTSGLQVKHLQYRTAFPVMNPGHGATFFGEVCMHFNEPSSFHIYEILHKKKQLELISGIMVDTIHHISLASYPHLFPKWIAFSIHVGKSGSRQSCRFLVCSIEPMK